MMGFEPSTVGGHCYNFIMNNNENLTLSPSDTRLLAADFRRMARITPEPYVAGSDPWHNPSADSPIPF